MTVAAIAPAPAGKKLALTFADDELMLEDGSRMLHDAYQKRSVDYRVIEPQAHSMKRIGHFGFFKPQSEKTLWPLVTHWLDQQLALRSAA